MNRKHTGYETARNTHGRELIAMLARNRRKAARLIRDLRRDTRARNNALRAVLSACGPLPKPTAAYLTAVACVKQHYADSPIPRGLPCGTDDMHGYKRDMARAQAGVYRAAYRVVKYGGAS